MESGAHHGHSPAVLLSATRAEGSHGTFETSTSRLPSSQKSFNERSNLQSTCGVRGCHPKEKCSGFAALQFWHLVRCLTCSTVRCGVREWHSSSELVLQAVSCQHCRCGTTQRRVSRVWCCSRMCQCLETAQSSQSLPRCGMTPNVSRSSLQAPHTTVRGCICIQTKTNPQ